MFDPLLPWRARAAGRVDAVLVTHSHVDHLNRWSLKAIDRGAHLVVPRGAKSIVADLGFAQVTEMTAGDQLADRRRSTSGGRARATTTAGGASSTFRSASATSSRGGGVTRASRRRRRLLRSRRVRRHRQALRDRRHAAPDRRHDAGLRATGGAATCSIGRPHRSRLRARHLRAARREARWCPIHWGTLHLCFGLPRLPRRSASRRSRRRATSPACASSRTAKRCRSDDTVVAERAERRRSSPITIPIA